MTTKTTQVNSVKKETSAIKAINKALIDRDITKVFKSGYLNTNYSELDEVRGYLQGQLQR